MNVKTGFTPYVLKVYSEVAAGFGLAALFFSACQFGYFYLPVVLQNKGIEPYVIVAALVTVIWYSLQNYKNYDTGYYILFLFAAVAFVARPELSSKYAFLGSVGLIGLTVSVVFYFLRVRVSRKQWETLTLIREKAAELRSLDT